MVIWIIRHKISREPKFHQYEIAEGAGRSIRAEFKIFSKGWDFRKG